MTKFEVIAYETENGDNPVEKFSINYICLFDYLFISS